MTACTPFKPGKTAESWPESSQSHPLQEDFDMRKITSLTPKQGNIARSNRLSGVLAAGFLTIVIAPPVAADDATFATRLVGYQETPLTINSAGSGEFKAKIRDDGTAIDYELTYRDLSSAITQSHIHFGRPALTGGVVLFLCTNLGNAPASVPTPQVCPAAPATITGSLTAANVVAVPGQGIDAGAAGFAEMLKAIRAGAAYTNVHTTGHPSGEIRGRLHSHESDEH
jgi:hypothetical protein